MTAGTVSNRALRPSKRSPEDELTNYPESSILSACSKAAISPTEIITGTVSDSTIVAASEPTSSTTVFGIVNGSDTTTATVPVATETIPAIGSYKVVHGDLSDQSGAYYGQYFADYTPGSLSSLLFTSTKSISLELIPFYFDTVGSYSFMTIYETDDEIFHAILCWQGAGKPNNGEDSSVASLLLQIPIETVYSRGFHPVYFNINFTTLVATPDNANNPMSNPSFWYCDGHIYYVDASNFIRTSDYNIISQRCVDTSLTALQGDP
ncbi:hypothetical protein TWF281_006712 [Arthrobotrys megalospora]